MIWLKHLWPFFLTVYSSLLPFVTVSVCIRDPVLVHQVPSRYLPGSRSALTSDRDTFPNNLDTESEAIRHTEKVLKWFCPVLSEAPHSGPYVVSTRMSIDVEQSIDIARTYCLLVLKLFCMDMVYIGKWNLILEPISRVLISPRRYEKAFPWATLNTISKGDMTDTCGRRKEGNWRRWESCP